MRSHLSTLGSSVAVSAISLALLAAPAIADEPSSCQGVNTTTSSGSCADIVSSSAQSTTTDSSFASVGTSGKILLRFQMSSGIKRHSVSGCKLVSERQAWTGSCVRLRHGAHFINSGTDTNNTRHKFVDVVTAKWMMFVHRSDGWHKAGDNNKKGNCGNWSHSFGSHHPSLTVRQVILVRSFANWLFSGHVGVKAHSVSTATSMSWCNQNGSFASATASGSGLGDATAAASYKVRGLTAITTWLKSANASLSQQLKLQVTAQAHANAKTNAVANASTKVSCSGQATQPSAPTITAQAQSCVAVGGTNGVITGYVGNPNASDDVAVVSVGSKTVEVTVAHGSTNGFTLSGFAPGTYQGTAMLKGAGVSTTFSVTVNECQAPPPANTLPIGTVTPPQHLYVNGTFQSTVTGHDKEDGSNVTIVVAVSGAASGGALNNCSESNGTKSCFAAIQAGSTPGTGSESMTVTDQDGGVYVSPTYNFPVLADSGF